MKKRFEMYKDLFNHHFESYSKENETIYSLEIEPIDLPSGKIVATDPISLYDIEPFLIHVQPGKYPVTLYIHQVNQDKRVSLAMIRFSDKQPASFEMAYTSSNKDVVCRTHEFVGYSVDSGIGSFMDKNIIDLFKDYTQEQAESYLEELDKGLEMNNESSYTYSSYQPKELSNNIITFSAGFGDGDYPSYFGFDKDNQVCCLITDFLSIEIPSEHNENIDWGKIYDSGYNHRSKIIRMDLEVEEINGFNHLAVYLRWCYEHQLLSDFLLQQYPHLPRLMSNPQIDVRQILIKEEAFNGQLRSEHFNDLGKQFTDYFYVFNRGSIDYYPHCVDDFAKEVLGEEKYHCEEYKDEAYLFNPYNECYYQGLSKYIDRVWELFLKRID